MGNKLKLFYDILTAILILWVIVTTLVFIFLNGKQPVDTVFKITLLAFGTVIYAYIYSIAVIILAIMKKKGINLFTMILGSVILPGLLPLVYYLFFIRKQLNNKNELSTTV